MERKLILNSKLDEREIPIKLAVVVWGLTHHVGDAVLRLELRAVSDTVLVARTLGVRTRTL